MQGNLPPLYYCSSCGHIESHHLLEPEQKSGSCRFCEGAFQPYRELEPDLAEDLADWFAVFACYIGEVRLFTPNARRAEDGGYAPTDFLLNIKYEDTGEGRALTGPIEPLFDALQSIAQRKILSYEGGPIPQWMRCWEDSNE